jgi:hypothetical protein
MVAVGKQGALEALYRGTASGKGHWQRQNTLIEVLLLSRAGKKLVQLFI